MKTITLELNMNVIPCVAKVTDADGWKREMDSFKVKYTSGQRVYITIISNGMKMGTISKMMQFVDGNVIVSFGKNKVNIGTYTEA